MHRNIVLGITAWLLGAATATAGCLLAVSLLGSGITSGGSGQLLSQDAVNQELVSEAAKSAPDETSGPAADSDPTLATITPSLRRSSGSSRPATTPASPTAGATGPGDAVAAGTAATNAAPTSAAPTNAAPTNAAPASAAPTNPAPASAAPTNPAPSGSASAGTVLASSAGTVVATCQAAGAYLISWSPQQGYEVGDVFRGPAATASAQFESSTSEVTMRVSCSGGVPSATTSADT